MFIPNPSSSVPDDWDEEEDGEWEPVMVSDGVMVSSEGRRDRIALL